MEWIAISIFQWKLGWIEQKRAQTEKYQLLIRSTGEVLIWWSCVETDARDKFATDREKRADHKGAIF
jgi:hypothetical protein